MNSQIIENDINAIKKYLEVTNELLFQVLDELRKPKFCGCNGCGGVSYPVYVTSPNYWPTTPYYPNTSPSYWMN